MENKQTSAKKRYSFYWIVLLLIIAVFLWFISCNNKPNSDTPSGHETTDTAVRDIKGTDVDLHEFDGTSVKDVLKQGLEKFKSQFGETISVIAIDSGGVVQDLYSTAIEMLKTINIVDTTSESGLRIVNYDDIRANKERLPGWNDERVIDSFSQHMQVGDRIVKITLRDKTGREYTSINTISEDGNRCSGSLFLSTVTPVQDTITISAACTDVVVLRYTWTNIPKILIRVCLSTTCRKGKIYACQVEKLFANTSLFTSVDQKCIDDNGMPDANGICSRTIIFAYATGFKTVEFSGKGTEFKIDGVIGMESKGNQFRVRKNCSGNIIMSY